MQTPFSVFTNFSAALETFGAGMFVSPAFEKIKKEHGPELAEDFLKAYRNHDVEAAARVSVALSHDRNCQIDKGDCGYIFQVANEQFNVESKARIVGLDGVGGYRSEAHACLAAGISFAEMRLRPDPRLGKDVDNHFGRVVR